MRYIIVKIIAMIPGGIGETEWVATPGSYDHAETLLADCCAQWPNDCFAIVRLPG